MPSGKLSAPEKPKRIQPQNYLQKVSKCNTLMNSLCPVKKNDAVLERSHLCDLVKWFLYSLILSLPLLSPPHLPLCVSLSHLHTQRLFLQRTS